MIGCRSHMCLRDQSLQMTGQNGQKGQKRAFYYIGCLFTGLFNFIFRFQLLNYLSHISHLSVLMILCKQGSEMLDISSYRRENVDFNHLLLRQTIKSYIIKGTFLSVLSRHLQRLVPQLHMTPIANHQRRKNYILRGGSKRVIFGAVFLS